jgi:hypothetical protein
LDRIGKKRSLLEQLDFLDVKSETSMLSRQEGVHALSVNRIDEIAEGRGVVLAPTIQDNLIDSRRQQQKIVSTLS